MNHNDFFKLIAAGKLQGAYILQGEEEFVKASALKAAEKLIPEDFRAFNLSALYEPDADAVTEACETLPLFGDKRLVICHGFAAGVDYSKLADYVEKLPEGAILLINIKGAADSKNGLVKRLRAAGREVEFDELPISDIMKWCIKTANKQGVVLDSDTARAFVGLVGTDMTAVSNELQKAIDMVGAGGTITKTVLSRCTVGNIEFQVFAMIDCFTAGKVKDGMRALHGLLEDGDAALGIASFLESRFKLMLEGRKLMDGGMSAQSAAAKLEGNRYANNKACTAAKKYSSQQLAELVGALANVGYDVVAGGAGAPDAIEKIMAAFEW